MVRRKSDRRQLRAATLKILVEILGISVRITPMASMSSALTMLGISVVNPLAYFNDRDLESDKINYT